jgi:transposase
MFEQILTLAQSRYQLLLKSIQKRYLVFDRGNNNPDNIQEIDAICRKWDSFFVASIKSKMVKSELLALEQEILPEIYASAMTTLVGKTIRKKVYGQERLVLLYVNPTVRAQKIANFLTFLEQLDKTIAAIIQKSEPNEEKVGEIKALLKHYNLITRFSIEVGNTGVKCSRIQEKIAEKIALFGKYALITNDFNLEGADIIRIYKTKDKIEQEFHLLKSLFEIRPIFHYRPNRIQTHFALVLWGVLFCALLKLVLAKNEMAFSFENLMNIIQEGKLSVGTYVYPENKTFTLTKTLNISPELARILKILKIKYNYFDIEVTPTPKSQKRGATTKPSNDVRND